MKVDDSSARRCPGEFLTLEVFQRGPKGDVLETHDSSSRKDDGTQRKHGSVICLAEEVGQVGGQDESIHIGRGEKTRRAEERLGSKEGTEEAPHLQESCQGAPEEGKSFEKRKKVTEN